MPQIIKNPADNSVEPENLNVEPDSAPEEEINLLELLLVLAKRWKMIILVPFAVAVITAIGTMFMNNIYTATTLILPSDDDKGGMSTMMAQLGGLAGIVSGGAGATKMDLYVTMLNSETIMDPIIDHFKLMNLYKAKLRVDAYGALKGSVIISAGKKDGIISIAVSDRDPKLATEIANRYVYELGDIAVGLSMSGAGKNRLFLEEHLATAKADLAKAGDELKDFLSRNKMVNVTEQAKASIDGVAHLRAQLAAQEVQLAGMLRQYTDSSQQVKQAKVAVGTLKSQIARLEGGGGNSSIPSVGSVPQLGQDYLRLMRDFKIQETMVELLTKQYEMARLSESKDLSPFQVFQKAKIPERKSKPKRSMIVILATVTSFFFMIFAAFVLEYAQKMNSDDRQRWQEILRLLPLPRRFFT